MRKDKKSVYCVIIYCNGSDIFIIFFYEIYPIIARALRGEASYFATPQSALTLSRILDAARLSSKLGQEVCL